MNIEQLVTMANQIGTFFKSAPDKVQAKKDIVMHIKRFWALTMRLQLIEYTQNNAGAGLEPLVKEAILEHQALLA
jgi:formate dehydrogenase subunit delta